MYIINILPDLPSCPALQITVRGIVILDIPLFPGALMPITGLLLWGVVTCSSVFNN